jgi:hypothetical protein
MYIYRLEVDASCCGFSSHHRGWLMNFVIAIGNRNQKSKTVAFVIIHWSFGATPNGSRIAIFSRKAS